MTRILSPPLARVALMLAGLGNVAAALVHIIGWAMGPEAIAFLGAPPYIVRSIEEGTSDAPVTIAVIVAVLAVFAAYAFSGAGLLPRLPFLRVVLSLVGLLFILRGLLIFVQLQSANFSVTFDVVHLGLSVVVLVLGVLYAIGAWRLWRAAAP
jgi:hypothetical protein